MANKTTSVLKQVEVIFQGGSASGLTDGELLGRFADRPRHQASDEAAFSAIVERHGGMVLRACRRILGDEHAAQDAAQATFLVLARRAHSIGRRDSVGAWLHGVALRVAAKSRVAAARRRVHERRGGEIAAGRMAGRAKPEPDPERWAELHEELGRLPEPFRAPVVLCDLEGLTQEQAAAQLRIPLGTVQSRLARGRAKLKARLTARGITPAAGALGLGLSSSSATAAPPSWVEATTRAAIQFTIRGSEAVKAGASPASAGLAWEVLRTMKLLNLGTALATTLLVALALAGAAALARSEPDATGPDRKAVKKEPAVTPEPVAKPKATDSRETITVRGIVRDDKGRPLAKAWIGSSPRLLNDTWESPRPEDIRERPEPFRDAKGVVIPPGRIGKYFEARSPKGPWRPVSPDDIRPWEGIVLSGGGALSEEEAAKLNSPYSIRVARGRWWMSSLPGDRNADRTDAEGRFTCVFPRFGRDRTKLHFASADFTLQAIHVVPTSDPGKPLDITLQPTRLVRARVIEVPKDDPKVSLRWFATRLDATGEARQEWQNWILPDPNANEPDHLKRRLETRLPAGRYRIGFESMTLQRSVDIEVPPGEAPLDLPDVRLESFANVRMIGHSAAEIDADDLEGKPVRLADFRGEVVVLDFWATWSGPSIERMSLLMELRRRFKDRPLVVLALHDGSIASAEEYRKAVGPIKRAHWGGVDLPLRVLIDRPQARSIPIPVGGGRGQKGSGRSADIYEVLNWPSTFVIATDGTLVGKFDGRDDLEGALEDQFGLPRSKPSRPIVSGRSAPPPIHRNVTVKGKVVGPTGEPVPGASLVPQDVHAREEQIRTGPGGEFAFTVEKILIDHFWVRVEAEGLAATSIRIGSSGTTSRVVKLGVGVAVKGRMTRDGKPVADIPITLQQAAGDWEASPIFLETKTDAQGRFLFPHAGAAQEMTLTATTGSFKDQGAFVPRRFKGGADGTTVELGDLEVRAGHKLAGRVVFSDGKAIPAKTTIMASAEGAPGLLRANVDGRGRFEVHGLPDGEVSVAVRFPAISTWLPEGYRLSARNKCLSPSNTAFIVGRLDRDVDDLTILFEPGAVPRGQPDPGQSLDFEEARAGTITAAPPELFPSK